MQYHIYIVEWDSIINGGQCILEPRLVRLGGSHVIGHSSVPEERERVRCCDVMGFLISHLNRYSDWTLEELNTFDICKFQSWGNGNRNRSYLNVKIRRYLDKHKFVTAGGVCWPHPLLPRYVMMIDGCPVAGSGLSLPPPSDDLWLSHQHCHG